MKKKCTVKGWISLVVLLLIFAGCKDTTGVHAHHEGEIYTCPMHPQVTNEGPGQCPICGMDLVPKSTNNELLIDSSLLPLLKPADEQYAGNLATITADGGTRIFSVPVQGAVSFDTRRQASIASRVSGRIEKLYIRYNYQPVRKGQLVMEIYSPELVAAQRELIYISRNDNDPHLLQKAKERLQLLGMHAAQINDVLRTGQPLYRVPVYSPEGGYIVDQTSLQAAAAAAPPMAAPSAPAVGGMDAMSGSSAATRTAPITNSPVLVREGQYVSAGETVLNIYGGSGLVADFYFAPSMASYLKQGQKILYYPLANRDAMQVGFIGLVEPRQRNGTTFTTVRVYIVGNKLQPGQLLEARVPVVARGWWLPEGAVVNLGNRSVVFKKENNVFVPKAVPVGIRIEGLVQVLDSVSNWEVAKNAGYLTGSESFIRLSEN